MLQTTEIRHPYYSQSKQALTCAMHHADVLKCPTTKESKLYKTRLKRTSVAVNTFVCHMTFT